MTLTHEEILAELEEAERMFHDDDRLIKRLRFKEFLSLARDGLNARWRDIEDKEPHRAHILTCRLEGDTKEDLCMELVDILQRLRADDLTTGFGGSRSTGRIYQYRHDPDMTPDAYFEALGALLKSQAPMNGKE